MMHAVGRGWGRICLEDGQRTVYRTGIFVAEGEEEFSQRTRGAEIQASFAEGWYVEAMRRPRETAVRGEADQFI